MKRTNYAIFMTLSALSLPWGCGGSERSTPDAKADSPIAAQPTPDAADSPSVPPAPEIPDAALQSDSPLPAGPEAGAPADAPAAESPRAIDAADAKPDAAPDRPLPIDAADGAHDAAADSRISDLPMEPTSACPVYVDNSAVDGGAENGSRAAPWRTIQAAIDHIYACDTIIVRRGIYREPVACSYKYFSVLKSEDGAAATVIDRSGDSGRPNGIELNNCSITIDGFTISGASRYGIYVYATSEKTVIQHNILRRNNQGIVVVYGPGNGQPVAIRNNIIIGDPGAVAGPYAGSGVSQSQSGGQRLIENNLIIGSQGTSGTSAAIFIDNWATGYAQNNIIADSYNGMLRYYDYNTMTIQYNCLHGNAHDYVKYAAAGTGDISADPLFMNDGSADGGTADYHLSPNSPCRNAGNPDPAFNNPDGTRNDIGPYGGPYGNW